MIPWFASEAFRKKTDLKYGTENVTTTSKIVAVRVRRNPGVAGRRMPISERSCTQIVDSNKYKEAKEG